MRQACGLLHQQYAVSKEWGVCVEQILAEKKEKGNERSDRIEKDSRRNDQLGE